MPAMKWVPEMPDAAGAGGEVDARRRAVADAFAAGGPLSAAVAGFSPRSAQQEMALAVFDAIATRSTLVAEAGTGTGKTMAYLVPALLAGGKVLVCAGTKTLQDQIFGKDLPAACRALGLRVEAANLKGRQNYVCRLRLERSLEAGTFSSRDAVRALHRIAQFIRFSDTGDRAELGDVSEDSPVWPAVTSTRDNCPNGECPHFDACFVMRARRAAMAADVVVVNHHLLLADMALRESTQAELLPNADTVIVDEAHQLARAAGDFFGEHWSLQQLAELGADSLRAGLQVARDGASWPDLVRALDTAGRAVRLALARSGAERAPRIAYDRVAHAPLLIDALSALDQTLIALEQALEANRGRDPELDGLVPRARALRTLVRAWTPPPETAQGAGESGQGDGTDGVPAQEGDAEAFVRWVGVSMHGAQFRATPLHCADAFIRAREERPQAWILTSATITTANRFEPFLDALGLRGCKTARWDSPYDYANQALLYLPQTLPDPRATDFSERVAQACWPALRASRGRAFILCSTLRAVERVARALRARMAVEDPDAFTLLVQGERSRRAMLETFRDARAAVLVGSMSFWEGIDVRGEALSLVAIDKLPFAPPDDPVVEARGRYLKRLGRDPFLDDQLPHAITLLRQGAGRLIRDETDRGVLMILDERVLRRSYGKAVLASLPPFRRTRDEEDVRRFFAEAACCPSAGQPLSRAGASPSG